MQMDMREPGLWGTWITTEERDMLERWRKEHPEGEQQRAALIQRAQEQAGDGGDELNAFDVFAGFLAGPVALITH